MKKVVIWLCLFCIISVSFPSAVEAEVGAGYELFGIFPHALTLTYRNRDTGWGFKTSADFGTSFLSALTSVFTSMFSIGTIDRVSFYTFSLTRDFAQKPDSRSYFKLGAMVFSARGSAGSATLATPSLGMGQEWDNFWNGMSGVVEVGYPELITIGMRYYF